MPISDEHQAIFNRATTIIAAAIRASSSEIRFKLPVQVWDDGGNLYGVAMEADILMLDIQPCLMKVSFTLGFTDTDEQIGEKAMTAVDAIELRIQCKIEPKKNG